MISSSDDSVSRSLILSDVDSVAPDLSAVEGGFVISGFIPASPPILDEEEDVIPLEVEDELISFFITSPPIHDEEEDVLPLKVEDELIDLFFLPVISTRVDTNGDPTISESAMGPDE